MVAAISVKETGVEFTPTGRSPPDRIKGIATASSYITDFAQKP